MSENPKSELRTQFLIWLGIPLESRSQDEKTQEQWGKKYGVSGQSMSVWKKDPKGKELTQNALKVLGGNEKLAIIQSLINKAKEGSFQHQRLYLEWQGEIGKKEKETPQDIVVTFTTKEPREPKPSMVKELEENPPPPVLELENPELGYEEPEVLKADESPDHVVDKNSYGHDAP